VDSAFESEYFDIAQAQKSCVPHEDGRPKHSVYVSTYRVLERIPLEAIGDLWLVTRDGRGLCLNRSDPPEKSDAQYHLYQELCPVHPLIASSLDAGDFSRFITDPEVTVSVPRICFAEMELGRLADDPAAGDASNLPYHNIQHIRDWLADDPAAGDASNLPYHNIQHIRDCLIEIGMQGKTTKTVNRIHHEHIPYRCVKSGFFVGDHTQLVHYPFPSREEMEQQHHYWWRSAMLA